MNCALSVLPNIKRSFAVSVIVILVALVLSWLGGGPAIISGTPLFDSDYGGVFCSLMRAILLILALCIAPLLKWWGTKFVVGHDRKRSIGVLVWAVLKIPIVGIVFSVCFIVLTALSGSSSLREELMVVLSGAIMIGLLLELIGSGIRHSAGKDEVGQAIQHFLIGAHSVVAAFAGGGLRGGVVAVVGISGILSIGLGGSRFVFGILFLLPMALTLPHMISWGISDWLYQKYQKCNNACLRFFTVLALIFNASLTIVCTVIVLVISAEAFNRITNGPGIPWPSHAEALFDQPWRQGASVMLIILWAISGTIVVLVRLLAISETKRNT